MKRYTWLTILLSLTISAVSSPLSAEQSPRRYPDSVYQLLAETKASINTVDMQAFKTILENLDYDMIIDVREADEYAGGHVPDAINIPRGVIEFRIWRHVGYPDNLELDRKIYLYCSGGNRCALAARSLRQLGFTDVTAVDMRIRDWKASGYPLTR